MTPSPALALSLFRPITAIRLPGQRRILRFGSCGYGEIFDPQNSQVRAGVASGDFRWKLVTRAGRHKDVLIVANGVLGRNDNARRPMNTARIKARPAVDGDHRRRGTLDQRREFIRNPRLAMMITPTTG
jgi:hypothetical protein